VLVTAETTFAYGHPLFEKIGIGGSVRYIYGNTFVDYTTFFEVDSVRELIKERLEFNNRQDGHDFAVDLGLVVNPTDWLRIGVVARNLNEPDFAVDLPAEVRRRLASAGIRARPSRFVRCPRSVRCVKHPVAVPAAGTMLRPRRMSGHPPLNAFRRAAAVPCGSRHGPDTTTKPGPDRRPMGVDRGALDHPRCLGDDRGRAATPRAYGQSRDGG
jgi:hypothetical protein